MSHIIDQLRDDVKTGLSTFKPLPPSRVPKHDDSIDPALKNLDLPTDEPPISMEEKASMPANEKRRRRCINWSMRAVAFYLGFAMPGLGMFSEGYIVFASGQIKPLLKALYPSCWATQTAPGCTPHMVKHVSGYVTVIGIIAGMLFYGAFGDFFGRKWGSWSVSIIMFIMTILLTFTPFASSPHGNFAYFVVAETLYGFSVGGEYPMASSSASERASARPGQFRKRGSEVVLTFSNQGLGTFINGCVILLCYVFFGAYYKNVSDYAARGIIAIQYGVGALTCLLMLTWRTFCLPESEVFTSERSVEREVVHKKNQLQSFKSMKYWMWRQVIASCAWFINDFAFYGQKLQQSSIIASLHPNESGVPYLIMRWTLLNSFIALVGYYVAAALVDLPWYGRCRMQYVGFCAVFIFNIIIYGQWYPLHGSASGYKGLQFLYYMTSFFQQFGPNCTTWLVSGEIFPTDIRASNHGFAAAIGKFGAIMSSLWLSYLGTERVVYLIGAMWALGGFLGTLFILPDTTLLDLKELDRMQHYILEDRFDEYHGEGVNPKNLSLWEHWILRWSKNYDPEADDKNFMMELETYGKTPEGYEQLRQLAYANGHEAQMRLFEQDGAKFDEGDDSKVKVVP